MERQNRSINNEAMVQIPKHYVVEGESESVSDTLVREELDFLYLSLSRNFMALINPNCS